MQGLRAWGAGRVGGLYSCRASCCRASTAVVSPCRPLEPALPRAPCTQPQPLLPRPANQIQPAPHRAHFTQRQSLQRNPLAEPPVRVIPLPPSPPAGLSCYKRPALSPCPLSGLSRCKPTYRPAPVWFIPPSPQARFPANHYLSHPAPYHDLSNPAPSTCVSPTPRWSSTGALPTPSMCASPTP